MFKPKQHIQKGESFALWRLPYTKQVKAVVSNTIEYFTPNFLKQKNNGFAFVPFDVESTTPSCFLKGDIITDVNTDIKTTLADFYLLNDEIAIDTPKNYTNNVAKGIEEIKSGGLKKVVVARNTCWEAPKDFCPITFFNTLCEQYPEAMVTLVSIKNIGTWVGATPELLLNVTIENLTTVALAGTQLKDNSKWTEKESEEQLWVVRYIENILAEFEVKDLDIAARKSISSGNLEHLYTQIAFKKEGTENNNLASQLLYHLHPTPAVGGLEKNEAIKFIKANENFNRSYYSGFLGEVNNENAALYVNLRCMQITNNGLIGYAGAGITKDSIPEKELQETEDKLNNLKSLLK